MDIGRRIAGAQHLTPVEHQLGDTVIALGGRLQNLTIKELAHAANVSIPSVHRFCKKIGLEGFKELKIEVARSEVTRTAKPDAIDINYPFSKGDDAEGVLRQMALVYEATLRDTQSLLDTREMEYAVDLLSHAASIDIYTQSHNLYPAQMFCDRVLSIGRMATCFETMERQIRIAMNSNAEHVAIAVSYSGMGPNLASVLPILRERDVPVIFIGTPRGARMHPGLSAYLKVSDRESLQNRITQFASHIAVQYVLDTLFGCLFARTYDASRAFLERSFPYTALPALRDETLSPAEFADTMLTQIR